MLRDHNRRIPVITIFHFIKDKTKGKHLWIRNNASTVVSQLVDSTIVYTVAFWGIIPNVWELVIVAWIMKIGVAVLDTPFLYLLKRYIRITKQGIND